MKRFQTIIRFSSGFLLCDAVSDASFSSELDFTEHPIDDGSVITDHAIRKPEKITLSLSHTQTPIRAIDGFAFGSRPLEIKSVAFGTQQTQLDIRKRPGIGHNVTALISAGLAAVRAVQPSALTGQKGLGASAKPLSVTVLQAGATVDRVGAFFSKLLALQTAVERLTVSFKGRDFADYVLISVAKSDKPGQLGKSSFQIELKKVRTVATKQTTLPAIPKAKAKQDKGAQFGPPPPPVTEAARRKTIARQVVLLAGGS